MAGEEPTAEGMRVERDVLQAELETMRVEKNTLAAQLECMQQECVTIQAEKLKLQDEVQSLLATRDALTMTADIAEIVTPGSGNNRRKEVAIDTKSDSIKSRPSRYSCVDQERAGKRLFSICLPDTEGKLNQYPCKRTQQSHITNTALEEETTLPHAVSVSKSKRRKDSAMKRVDTEPCPLKRRKRRSQQSELVDRAGSNDDSDNVSSLAVCEEDGLEDLHISFDDCGVSLIPQQGTGVTGDVQRASAAVGGGGAIEMGEQTHDQGGADSPDSVKCNKPQSKRQYVCKQCSRAFRWVSHYINHLKTHPEKKSLQCPDCPQSFARVNMLALHMHQHNTPHGQHTCTHCTVTFLSSTSLRKHVHQSHSKKARKVFGCEQCGETFSRAADLGVHMGVHTDGKPFQCVDCKAAFTTRGNLTVHRKKHRGENPFHCTDCNAMFPCHSDLKSHARRHATEKPYKCDFCSAAFCRAGDLKPHMRTHTGEKPFQCEVCGAAFSTSSNLAVHRRIHTGEKPFQCEQCGSSFSQLGHLTRHRSQHATDCSFSCSVCPAAFGNAYNLKVHMQRHNLDNTFKCKCGAAFSRASILTEHMRIHTGEKPFKCSQCPAAFARSANLMAHRRKHTGERPYVCPHCKQGFTQSTSLNRHLQSQKACRSRQGDAPPLPALPAHHEGDVEHSGPDITHQHCVESSQHCVESSQHCVESSQHHMSSSCVEGSQHMSSSCVEGSQQHMSSSCVEGSQHHMSSSCVEGSQQHMSSSCVEGSQQHTSSSAVLDQDFFPTDVRELSPGTKASVMTCGVTADFLPISVVSGGPHASAPLSARLPGPVHQTGGVVSGEQDAGGTCSPAEGGGMTLPEIFPSKVGLPTSSPLQHCGNMLVEEGGAGTSDHHLPCSMTEGVLLSVVGVETGLQAGRRAGGGSLRVVTSLTQSADRHQTHNGHLSTPPPPHLPHTHAHLHQT